MRCSHLLMSLRRRYCLFFDGKRSAHLPPVASAALLDDAVLVACLRSPHYQQTRQDLEEDLAHPRGHRVGRRGTEVDIEHDYRHDDRQRDEYHREEKVFADEWNDNGRRRDYLCQQQEEDGERQ